MMNLLKIVYEAGIVGAGGAGFPTHKKLSGEFDTVIVNAAECEPLLESDRCVMRNYAAMIAEALSVIRRETGASRVVIGTKKKYEREIAALRSAFAEAGADFEIFGVSSFYPAGDEQVMIYEITGRTVPPGGIPLALGIVVLNITTVLDIWRALHGVPVTEKLVTVTGEVKRPVILKTPVGTRVTDCIAAAGGTLVDPWMLIKGGPMMGRQFGMSEAEAQTIGKADGGLIVLSPDHALPTFSRKPLKRMINEAKSACIQCSYCTELCPRYLIGHKMRPHRVMRSIATGTNQNDLTDAVLCCECGICELFSCPMRLSPRRINVYVKGILRSSGAKLEDRSIYPEHAKVRDYRRIAQKRFIARLELGKYDHHIDEVVEYTPKTVSIPLKHGVGRPSEPVVSVGDVVNRGDVIASVPFDDVGCVIHASIDGVITCTDGQINITREERTRT
ncbi:MAG: SLBB domain-containing protein [Synergistaceae bacterium]|jgi:Na+-translocating ferredoxin:NAD+ oxidoreductase RnfC subunit|nr:SLBB domain-containing protein [Synergistaceae bacterium]